MLRFIIFFVLILVIDCQFFIFILPENFTHSKIHLLNGERLNVERLNVTRLNVKIPNVERLNVERLDIEWLNVN
jgi:hypothetical protein